jgi:signal transduction histidine kinase
VAGLVALGAVHGREAFTTADAAKRADAMANAATSTVRLVHELEREAAESVALRQRGGRDGAEQVNAQHGRTDVALARYRQASDLARRSAPAVGAAMTAANGGLGGLGNARRDATVPGPAADTGDRLYRSISAALVGTLDALPRNIDDLEAARAARELAWVAAIEYQYARERDVLYVILAQKRFQPGGLAAVASLVGGREQREAEFVRSARRDVSALYTTTMRGAEVDAAQRIRVGVLAADRNPAGLSADQEAWFAAETDLIRRVNSVSLNLSERLERATARTSKQATQRVWTLAGTTGGIALFVLVLAFVQGARASRRLRRLWAATMTEPPGDGSGPPGDASEAAGGRGAPASLAAIAAHPDEIGLVAEAVATMRESALTHATEQAAREDGVRTETRSAEIMAERIRGLITRQLCMLDEFERNETDPDALGKLFALDHLAARLRRSGDSLLLLTGGNLRRTPTHPVPLARVVTAAAAEIEDYHRVVAPTESIGVAAEAVGDLVHLLAELLENATVYSPAESEVQVDATTFTGGATIRIQDTGIGLRPDRITALNARLTATDTLSTAAAGTMGLTVVAHLARRHGIGVRLESPNGAGTIAHVDLPSAVLAEVPSLPEPSRSASIRAGDGVTTNSAIATTVEWIMPAEGSAEAARAEASAADLPRAARAEASAADLPRAGRADASALDRIPAPRQSTEDLPPLPKREPGAQLEPAPS